MKKLLFQKISSIFLLLVITFSLTGIASAADPAFSWKTDWQHNGYITNNINNTIKVKSNIRVTAISGPIYKLSVSLRAENLPANEAEKTYVYQAWLVNNTTGWRTSIGSTIRKNNGTGDMSYVQYMSYPKVFDTLILTKEKIFDLDPAPSDQIVYSGDINIPAFTELGYRTTLSPKNMVPALPNSNKGGSGKFIIDTKKNLVKYKIEIKNIAPNGRSVGIYGPARPGANGPLVTELATSVNNIVIGEWRYEDSIEEKLVNGEYYIQVNVGGGATNTGVVRGQIVF